MAALVRHLNSRLLLSARVTPSVPSIVSSPINKWTAHKIQMVKFSQLPSKISFNFTSLSSYEFDLSYSQKRLLSPPQFNSTCYTLHFLHTDALQHQKKALSKEVKEEADFTTKAKEATKTTYYAIVILVGFGLVGVLGYAIFGELFASFSPQRVYSHAAEQCTEDKRVQDLLGNDNLKCYGEETRRGRRQHVSHLTYSVDGQNGMRMKFYIKGSRRSATAQLDARDSPSGWYYRYLYVQLDQYPHQVIVVQDNRGIMDETPDSTLGGQPLDTK